MSASKTGVQAGTSTSGVGLKLGTGTSSKLV